MRLLSCSEIRLFLRSRLRSGLFFVAVFVPSLALVVEVIRIGAALTLGRSSSLPTLRWAVILDPENGDIHDRLGKVAFYGLDRPHEVLGLEHLRRATQLNPLRALYWSDLGSACESVGNDKCAAQAFERAMVLDPLMPRLHWLSANFYLRTGRMDAAIAQFRTLLRLIEELHPDERAQAFGEYTGATYEACLSMIKDPEVIFDRVLPHGQNPKLELQFIDFLSKKGRADPAYEAWRRVVAQGLKFPFSSVEPYLDRLIESGRYQEAEKVWQDLQDLGVVNQLAKGQGNLVFNGGFEKEPLNGGFDWRSVYEPYIIVGFADHSARQGKRSLRVEFTVKRNDEYEPVFQYVPVTPDREYTLAAYVKSSEVISDCGPRLRVLDPARPGVLDESTEGTAGTTDWHPIGLTFFAGAQTRVVKLSVWRTRCRAFPFEITGRFWVDDVALTPAAEGRYAQ